MIDSHATEEEKHNHYIVGDELRKAFRNIIQLTPLLLYPLLNDVKVKIVVLHF